jgi:hypothetical protein
LVPLLGCTPHPTHMTACSATSAPQFLQCISPSFLVYCEGLSWSQAPSDARYERTAPMIPGITPYPHGVAY